MALVTIIAGLTLAQTADQTITYQDGVFTLKSPSGDRQISTLPGPRPMNTSTGRLWLPVADKVLTFDENGIGIRHNNRRNHSTLPSIATSDKLFTQQEADEINRAVANEEKSLDLAALSGWELVETTAYLLVRWEDKENKPWLEALVAIDLSQATPQTTLVGRFQGLSQAKGQVNDKLSRVENTLQVATVKEGELGLETYSLETKEFARTPLSPGLPPQADFKLLPDSRFGVSFQPSPHNTVLVGTFNVDRPGHHIAAEIHGPVLDVLSPSLLVHLRQNRKVVLNLLTGAEIEVPRDSGLESTPQGLLLWTPAQSPRQAALYNYGAFRTISRWSPQPQ